MNTLTEGPIVGEDFDPRVNHHSHPFAILESQKNEVMKNTEDSQSANTQEQEQIQVVQNEHIDNPKDTEDFLNPGPETIAAVAYIQSLDKTASIEQQKLATLVFDIKDGGHIDWLKEKISKNVALLPEEIAHLLGIIDPQMEESVTAPQPETETEAETELEPEPELEPDNTEVQNSEEAYNAYVESLPPEEVIRENLAQARTEYASQNVLYKNALREKKGKFKKVMGDLGFPGKQMPEVEKPEALILAEAKYIEAKKQLRVLMTEQLKADEQRPLSLALIEQAEKEYASLQKKILENVPPLEKGIITKSFEKWAKLPLPARVALSTTLITAGALAFGSVGLAAGATAGAYRFGRSLAGGFASQKAGKMMDIRLKKKSSERKEDALDNYVDGEDDTEQSSFNLEKLAEKERELMAFYDKEENQLKRDRLKKAGAMIATGAAASAAVTEIVNLSHSIDTVHAAGAVAHIATPNHELAQPQQPDQSIQPIEVEVSSRGYIDTFAKLKDQMAEHYPDSAKAPAEIKELLALSPEKLAMKFGFYKPGETLQSAFGLKGEHVVIDKDGSVIFQGLKGNKEVLFDAKTGLSHTYEGKMFDAQASSHTTIVETPEQTPAQPAAIKTHVAVGEPIVDQKPPSYSAGRVPEETHNTEHSLGKPVIEQKIDITRMASAGLSSESLAGLPNESVSEAFFNGMASSDIPKFENSIVYKVPGGEINVLESETDKKIQKVYFNDLEIAKPTTDFKNEADIASGKLPLSIAYQFDPKYKNIRSAYNIMFERMAMTWPAGTVDNMVRIDHQGGRIIVMQKGNKVDFLLNGQIIAMGNVSKKGKVDLTNTIHLKNDTEGAEKNFMAALNVAVSKLENSPGTISYRDTI